MASASRSILHVSQPAEYGVARCVAAAAADQVRRGWKVAVACPLEGTLADDVRRAGATHHPWNGVRSPVRGVAREARGLQRIIDIAQPDLVHLHSSKAGLVGRLALRGRQPTLFHTHAWSFLALPRGLQWAAVQWERVASRWSTLTICCSEGEAEQGRAVGIKGRIAVVPNGVPVPAVAPAAEERDRARSSLGFDDQPLAVCIGRLSHQKGQDVLMRAWRQVHPAIPQANLVLVGDGPDQADLEAAAPAGVTFAGFHEDVAPWLLAADVVVVPSRYDTLPLTLLQAMAAGRSIVASAIPGVVEAIDRDPSPGALVPPEDAGALAAALTERLGDRERAWSEGQVAHRTAAELYAVDRWCDTIAEITLGALDAAPDRRR